MKQTNVKLTNTDLAELIVGAYMAMEEPFDDIFEFAEAVQNKPMSTIISLPSEQVETPS